ncbi:MAG: sulfatase-like hydrolase/transferase, partial [Rhodospirillales bacterium]|nr:sulfatase-like hydrolase/transferase [Rhodospirillales bacterium]
AYLEDHAAKAGDDPFFIQCSFPDPHHPFTPPGKYWDMFDPDDMDLPDCYKDSETPPRHVAAIRKGREDGKQNRDGQRVIAINEREAREAKALTYGMIRNVDDRISQVLAKLDELGLAENTVVIFTTDHGDFLGDHQLLLKGALHYQGVVRVPFIWADPAAPGAGAERDDPSGTVDIATTVLARAGLAPHNGVQGRDLMTDMRDDPMVLEEHQRYGYMGFSHGFRARTLMGRRWRLTIYDDVDALGELYDLENDPGEQRNLFDDPAHKATRIELTEELLHRMMGLMETSPLATHHGP